MKLKPIILNYIQTIDDTILDYIEATIEDLDQSESVKENVYPFLNDAGCTDEVIDAICDQFEKISNRNLKIQESNHLKILEKPLVIMDEEMDSQVDMFNFANKTGDITLVNAKRGVNNISYVDAQKLEKAEQKLKLKQEKRKEMEEKALSMAAVESKVQESLYSPAFNTASNKSRDVKVEGFDIGYPGKPILSNATLSLAYGRRYGLVGRNGEGKSTLLRYISSRRINIPAHISILHVEQEIVGDDTLVLQSVLSSDTERLYLLDKEKKISKQLQDESLDEMKKTKLSQDLKDVYQRLEDIEADKAESRASIILIGLGFTQEMQARATKSFSGGWRMRLALARALFMKPDLLLLDEPTNMLDVPSVAWLENYLIEWPKTLLVVSHDREFLDSVSTDIIYLHHQRLDSYRGNYSYFESTKEERLKNQQREYDAQLQYRQHLQEFIDRFRYNAKRAAQAQSKIKILEKLPPLEPVVVEAPVVFQFPDVSPIQNPVLQLRDVYFTYPNTEKQILQKVNFSLDLTSRMAIVGPNGAGKSTFLKLMCGALDPTRGMCHRQAKLKFAFFSQHHLDQLNMNLSSIEYLQEKFPGMHEEEYRRHLGSFGITGSTSQQTIATLSGGQKSRVVFAMMSLTKPHVLILDEPTNHLDMDTIDALLLALKKFNGGVVVVSHDSRFVESICDHLYVCENSVLTEFKGTIREYKKHLQQLSMVEKK